MGRDVRRSVEPQTRDNRVGVTIARVNRDPLAAAALAILAKFSRTDRRLQQTRAAECIGNRSRTIVAAINERPVPAAEDVRFAKELVGCPNRPFYRKRSRDRSGGLTATKFGAASGHSRPGRGERIRVKG